MTPQEQQLLVSLTQRINQTRLQEKDPDAENLLGRELGANPDAVYILAQTVLVQDIALQQAKAQMTQLQQQFEQARQQPAHASSFLGRLLGEHDPQQAPHVPPSQQLQQAQAPPFQPVPGYQAPPQAQQPASGAWGGQPYPPPQYGQPQFAATPPGQPSFMRGAMQTAAGVAAGALAFEGVESILHGFGHGGYGPGTGMAGFGMAPGMGMGGGFGRPVDETVVNNYYDAPPGSSSGMAGAPGVGQAAQWSGSGQSIDAANEPHFHESADQLGGQGLAGQNGAQLTDAGYNTGADETAGAYDQGQFDPGMQNDSVTGDTSADDVQIDDSGGGLDDGGGLDSGGGFDSSGGDGF